MTQTIQIQNKTFIVSRKDSESTENILLVTNKGFYSIAKTTPIQIIKQDWTIPLPLDYDESIELRDDYDGRWEGYNNVWVSSTIGDEF